MADDPSFIPGPDPTTRTVEQLLRETAALKELIFTRLNAMDKSLELFRDDMTRVPTDVDRQVGTLKELVEETFRTVDQRFATVQVQFAERDVRAKQEFDNASKAVEAALAAARELGAQRSESNTMAVAKNETFVLKQLEQLQVLLAAETKALDARIMEIKDRVTASESRDIGQGTAKSSAMGGQNQLIAIIGVMVSIALALGALFTALNRDPAVVERVTAAPVVERIIERDRERAAVPVAPAPVSP